MIKEALFLFSKINSFGVHGVEGFPVTVEADVSDGLPGFIMEGFLSEAGQGSTGTRQDGS